MLILASISITTLFGQDGIITKAQEAARKTKEASENEQEMLNYATGYIANILSGREDVPAEPWESGPIASKFENDNTGEIKIGDKVKYTPDSGVTSYEVSGVRHRKSDTY